MFLPILESTEINDATLHTLSDGSLICGFEVGLIDEENTSTQKIESLLGSIVKDLPLDRNLRIYFKSEFSKDTQLEHSRSQAIQKIGYIKNRAFIVLEKPANINLKLFERKSTLSPQPLLTDFEELKENGISVQKMSAAQINELLPKLGSEINHNFQTLDLGQELVSLIRLTKQSEFGMDFETLSHIKDTLAPPYTICCQVRAVSQSAAETLLRRRSKQTAISQDLKEGRKFDEAQNDLEEVSLTGTRLYRFEWQCLINRNSEDILRSDREDFKRRLQPLGETYIESVGALESLKSFYPGGSIHFSMIEKGPVLLTYLPLITRGDSFGATNIQKRSLITHRIDESLTPIDIFNPEYESFSWCIFGRPGTGKSILTNAITRALVSDPSIQIIKIDVGGSHSRETEILGGTEKTLSLNEPTGINPFNIFSELGPTNEAVQIIAAFVEVLILEENESKLSKTMKSELERAIQFYAESSPTFPTLEDFYASVQDLPRKSLLSRWVGSGLYGNAFSTQDAASLSPLRASSLLYYNFAKISQALDPDYAQGGLAAVMSQFNLAMLKKEKSQKRIVFIADETPFFIQKCFSFFNLSIANVRKEGHGFITIAQKTSHVVVDGDTGILDNSPNKIFFSRDGDDDSFMARTQLEASSLQKIKSLYHKQGKFSECLIKDKLGERILRLRLSPDEYWAYTSKDEDKRKYNELKQACPSLSSREIIQCLSL